MCHWNFQKIGGGGGGGGEVDFSHNNGGVGKMGGVVLRKWEIIYFHIS